MMNTISVSGIDTRFYLSDAGWNVKLVPYKQRQRRSGKSSYNLWRSLNFSINSMVRTSTTPLRIATITGIICSFLSFLIGMVYLMYKITHWNSFSLGSAPVLIGTFFIGAVILFFIGILGEYIGVVLYLVTPMIPPFVKELINFDNANDDPYLIQNGEKKDESIE